MKRFIALLVISCLAIGQALAIRPASKKEYDRIQKYLTEAERIDKVEIVKLKRQETAVANIFTSAAHYERIRIHNEITYAEKERDLARDKAIHITLLAYGIAPADSSGKPDMPKGIAVTNDASKGLLRHWHAIASDNKERWGRELVEFA